MSASNVSDVTSLTDGKSAQSTSGDTQVVSLSGGVSTMGSSGGMTCYKAACSSGYYLDAPNSTYFTSTSTTGTIGLTCYKATGCKSGYYNGGSSYSYHGYYCSKCTYSCPDGYSTSTTSSSCGSGYTFESTSATTQSGCSPQTCGICEKKYYDPVTVTVTATLSKPGYDVQGIKYRFTLRGDKMYSSGEITCDDVSGSLNNCLGGSIDVPPGDYTVSVMMNSARIRKTGTLPWGQWSFIDATCSSKNISISGSSPTDGTYVTCSSGSINDR